jgi:hypothetical protein
MTVNVLRTNITWPVYRWACADCDALETYKGEGARRKAMAGAREHAAVGECAGGTDVAKVVASFDDDGAWYRDALGGGS